MGCISSKFITKSLSFREDLSNRKRGVHGLTVLDELFTSDDGNSASDDHQFFALVSRLRTGDFVLPPEKSLESRDKETINTWELMAGLEEQAEIDKLKRSKSCEISKLATAFELNDDQENKGVGRSGSFHTEQTICQPYTENMGVGRSTSFHTVEEYDAMMGRIRFSVNNDVAKYQETTQSISRSLDENNTDHTSEPDIKEVIPDDSSGGINKDGGQDTSTCDAGLKRKALRKGLESLQIPSAAEFRKTGSLKDWLQNGGNVGSPGEYVTPKFGNYNKPKSKLSEEYRDDSIFNPELVAAFEEFLEQLEVEEDSILEQIEGNRDEITATE